MPLIGARYAKCVFYLFAHTNDDRRSQNRPWGTGFFVGRYSKRLQCTFHIYAVSNIHVVSQTPNIRINTKPNNTRIIELEFDDWKYSAAGEDLAAADVTDHLPINTETMSWQDDFSWVSEHTFVRPPHKDYSGRVGIGDDTFMIGLFEDHRGGERNSPVGRFGNIAAIPNDAMPISIEGGDRYSRPGFLNDMRSRTGFSGSPVWMWRSGIEMDELPNPDWDKYGVLLTKPYVGFVGVHRGQIQENTRIRECKDFPALSNTEIRIASSMTAVIPSWQITALIDSEIFEEKRVRRDQHDDRVNLHRKIMELRQSWKSSTIRSYFSSADGDQY